MYFLICHSLGEKENPVNIILPIVKKEITPYIDEWEEAGDYPRELHKKIADLGYNAIAYPSEYGDSDGDQFEGIVVNEEFCRCGSFGLVASLFSHGIAVPP